MSDTMVLLAMLDLPTPAGYVVDICRLTLDRWPEAQVALHYDDRGECDGIGLYVPELPPGATLERVA